MNEQKYSSLSKSRPEKVRKGERSIYCCIPECGSAFYDNEDKNTVKINQLDLMKIHNFDYKATRVSLKVLEVNMCMDSIEDLDFKIGEDIKIDDFDNLIKYNKHDVEATLLFFEHSKEAIEFREELGAKYNENITSALNIARESPLRLMLFDSKYSFTRDLNLRANSCLSRLLYRGIALFKLYFFVNR